MTTRLDRLVLLLDTGSTPGVRRTAAQQLGEIQKQHPGELYNLLSRVVIHLRSKSWETRLAAGQALEAIASNLPPWEPAKDVTSPPQDDEANRLNFAEFDLHKVLQNGRLLLGSAGKEYDVDPSDATQLLEKVRRDLRERLGFGGRFMMVDLLEDADVGEKGTQGTLPTTAQQGVATTTAAPAIPIEPVPEPTPAAPEIKTEGLSARERNMLKRKMKMDAKMSKNKEKVRVMDLKGKAPPQPVKVEPTEAKGFDFTAQPESNKFVVEPKKAPASDTDAADQLQYEWPFMTVCEHLCVDLFNPVWEIRHGAGIGLRSILKSHGVDAGKIAGVSDEENDRIHDAWLEDAAIRLLCVFALDRFADFISDQVVCPVRETCAQTLGVVLQYLKPEAVAKVNTTLMKFIHQDDASFGGRSIWEVRHAGLLGLKYAVAVRKDLVDYFVEGITDAVILGLKDHDDDVRAVSAATLLPITAEFVRLSPTERVRDIMATLWDCLIDLKDDLTASTGTIMELITKMSELPGVIDIVMSGTSLSVLVPRLHPFFRHTIIGVRVAVLNTLMTFLRCGTASEWADEKVYRLVFQNLLVEQKEEVLNKSLELWQGLTIGDQVDQAIVLQGTQAWLGSWFEVTMTPIGQPLDTATYFYKPPGVFSFGTRTQPKQAESTKARSAGKRGGKSADKTSSIPGDNTGIEHNVDAGMIAQDFSLVKTEQVTRCRVACATALGRAMSTWPDDTMEMAYHDVLLSLLSSQWAIKRHLGAVVIEEWAKAVLKQRFHASCISEAGPEAALATLHRFPQALSEALTVNLENSQDPENTAFYFELVHLLKRIRSECQALFGRFSEAGINSSSIPQLPPYVNGEVLPDQGPLFTIENASYIVGESYTNLLGQLSKSKNKNAIVELLDSQRKRIISSLGYYEDLRQKIEIHVYASAAGALVELGVLPQKLTPVIRNVMNSIQFEENQELQQRSAATLADLIALCARAPSGRTNPNDKVVKNICTFLCADPNTTPVLRDHMQREGVLSVQKDTDKNGNAPADKDAQLMKRGAVISIHQLCDIFGDNVFSVVPKLWDCMRLVLVEQCNGQPESVDVIIEADIEKGQDLIDALTVITTVVPFARDSLWDTLASLVPHVCVTLQSVFAVLRQVSARCLSTIANAMTTRTMQTVIEKVLPLLGDMQHVHRRQGASELIYHLVQLLDIKILPYTIFLVVPILARMSDPDDAVRLVCTNCFALLIKLVPLEAGIPDPEGMSSELLAHREEERRFLEQLLDSSKVESFVIPVKINAELRKYQQEGVNWLAFLNRFHLHGILCDDMGLGKTLQSICILASDHHLRAKRFEATQAPDAIRLPSLVICPPTLTGHWYHEMINYCDNLKPLLYTGGPAERKRLRGLIPKHEVIIMSYDIIRNDIDDLARIQWNYCILDEGHIIKNGKTKVTKAIKTIQSNHRLILSGTPVQNNVLELWSLFDFLMPGFLGSEKIFNERFSKPILTSRDSKSSSKDQEAGALALEALHKQVLPFLLRRLKEDVLHDLPPKIIQDYYCELSPLQKSLYEEFAKSQSKSAVEHELEDEKNHGTEKKSATHIFQALQYLRKLCNHPLLVMNEKHPSYKKIQNDFSRSKTTLHDIHNAPKLLALKQLLIDCGIGVTAPAEADADAAAVAMDAVSQHRALVFCQLKTMLDIIENDLLKKLMPTVSYLRLDGSVDASKRHDLVQKFNADPSIDVLLLTTHVGGLGLNLTGADTVIFVEHDWNPMKDLQAMDRAHRIGQKKVVNVYRLITRGTLEEKIMGLQKFKLNIANTIVNQQNSGLQSMDTDQILDLFNMGSDGTGSQDDAKKKKKIRAAGDASEPMGPAKAVLENLEGLWDEKEYEEEYNIDSFISNLNHPST